MNNLGIVKNHLHEKYGRKFRHNKEKNVFEVLAISFGGHPAWVSECACNDESLEAFIAQNHLIIEECPAIERCQSGVFEDYLAAVDAWVVKKTGFSYLDFADIDFYTAWTDGLTPEEAGRECLENDSTGAQLLQMIEEV